MDSSENGNGEESTTRVRRRPRRRSPVLKFLGVGVAVLGIGAVGLLIQNNKKYAAMKPKVEKIVEMDIPEAPGCESLDDISREIIEEGGRNVVIGVYSYGKRSSVQCVKLVGRHFFNHDIAFYTIDHDVCRLSINELSEEGVLGSPVEISECPLVIFLKHGSEVAREEGLDELEIQKRLDDIYHGGRDSMKQLEAVWNKSRRDSGHTESRR